MDIEELSPNLLEIIDSNTLKWIFVGGKGGVGKTSCSSSLSVLIAKRKPNKKVLLISTDPAHNTSDAFNQKFNSKPTLVNGVNNLSVMEIEVTEQIEKLKEQMGNNNNNNPQQQNLFSQLGNMTGLMTSFPGIDEAIAFSQIVKQVREMNYDIVIFDTAPTGHTLKFLSLPNILKQLITKIIGLQQQLGPMISSMSAMMGQPMDTEKMVVNLKEMLGSTEQIVEEFKNPDLTTFIPVLIPEFLPLYETERLLQELAHLEMDANSIIVNQILPEDATCKYCLQRKQIQNKYLKQIDQLYIDFHVCKINTQTEEIRGVEALSKFSQNFLKEN